MQKLFTTFRAAVESLPLGEQKVGLIRPGRYNGFCSIVPIGGMQIELIHVNEPFTQVQKTTFEDGPIFAPFGAILMPSGVIIHESESIIITPDANGGAQTVRRDLVICEHNYNQVIGGTPAQYIIIKGTPDGNLPPLTNPYKQIIIGQLLIPAGAVNAEDIKWLPSLPSLPGDMTPAQLWNLINVPIPPATTETPGTVQFATPLEVSQRAATDKVLTPGNIQNMKAGAFVPEEELGDTGPQQYGLTVYANDDMASKGESTGMAITPEMMRKHARKRTPIYHTTGSIVLPQTWNGQTVIVNGDSTITPVVTIQIPNNLTRDFTTRIISRSQGVKFVVIGSNPTPVILLPTGKQAEIKEKNQAVTLENIDANNPTFYINGPLKDIATNLASGLVPRRAAIPYFPANNSLSEFDSTGKGISGDVIGWAICNGQNTTRDLRGKFLIQADPSKGAYDVVGKLGGAETVTLTKEQLPASPVKLFSNQETNISANRLQSNGERAASARGFGEGSADHDYTLAGDPAALSAVTFVGNSAPMGSGEAHPNMPPYYTTIYIQQIIA